MKAILISLLMVAASCSLIEDKEAIPVTTAVPADSLVQAPPDTVPAPPAPSGNPQIINTGAVTPAEVLAYAKTLQGIPYKYASTDPAQGFDCSGFITYVFNHFGITVPRSSIDFTNVLREVPLAEAMPGDLVLFTGTDSTIRVVGHMGILTTTSPNAWEFIHSTSGKSYGVTISPLSTYYRGRFVKAIRIFPQND